MFDFVDPLSEWRTSRRDFHFSFIFISVFLFSFLLCNGLFLLWSLFAGTSATIGKRLRRPHVPQHITSPPLLAVHPSKSKIPKTKKNTHIDSLLLAVAVFVVKVFHVYFSQKVVSTTAPMLPISADFTSPCKMLKKCHWECKSLCGVFVVFVNAPLWGNS